MSEDEKLKPCPFCGGEATRTTMRKFKYVSCENSDCSMVVEAGALFSREEEAIAVWNTRPTEQTAYERGKAEERARIEARLQAKREGDNSLAENAYELGAPSVNVASFRIAKQVWDMAIEIVNQE